MNDTGGEVTDEYIILALRGSLYWHSFPRSLSPGLRGSAWLSSILTAAVTRVLSSSYNRRTLRP